MASSNTSLTWRTTGSLHASERVSCPSLGSPPRSGASRRGTSAPPPTNSVAEIAELHRTAHVREPRRRRTTSEPRRQGLAPVVRESPGHPSLGDGAHARGDGVPCRPLGSANGSVVGSMSCLLRTSRTHTRHVAVDGPLRRRPVPAEPRPNGTHTQRAYAVLRSCVRGGRIRARD